MADVWKVYEGCEPTRGQPWASLPLDVAIVLLELKPEQFISDETRTPRFGLQDRDLSIFGYKHVVVEVHHDESRPPKWKAGFYHSTVSPESAFDLVLRNALVQILGEANVVRVEHSSSTDSIERTTLRVMVVLAPGASAHITGEISLRALGRLRELLSGLNVEGSPILQYATEAELAQNDQ